VIANELDEQALSNTQDITISADRSGNWHIRDFGRDVHYENLTQNENPAEPRLSDVRPEEAEVEKMRSYPDASSVFQSGLSRQPLLVVGLL
jgi:hypothetical protein